MHEADWQQSLVIGVHLCIQAFTKHELRAVRAITNEAHWQQQKDPTCASKLPSGNTTRVLSGP
jgi:hypothetical protein